MREAIRQSLQDPDKPGAGGGATSSSGTADLLDFGGDITTPAPAPAARSAFPGAPGALPPPSDPFGAWGARPAPAATATAPNYAYGAQPPAGAPLPALPPSAPAENGYGKPAAPAAAAAAPAPQSGPYTTPWNGPTSTPSTQQSAAYGAAPAAAASWNAPSPVNTQTPSYGHAAVPQSVTPQAQPTPSTIGFASPPPSFAGFTSPPASEAPQAQPAPGSPSPPTAATAAPAAVDPALMSMNTLSGQQQDGLFDSTAGGASLADQAYAKLVNLDTFSLASKRDEPAANPFASSSSITDNRSLADMQKKKVRRSFCVLLLYLPHLS